MLVNACYSYVFNFLYVCMYVCMYVCVYVCMYVCLYGSHELNMQYVMFKEDGCNNVITFPAGTHLCVCPQWVWGPRAVQGSRRGRFRLLGYQQPGPSSQDPDSRWTAPWLWLYVTLKFYITCDKQLPYSWCQTFAVFRISHVLSAGWFTGDCDCSLTLCRSNLNPYCLGRKAAFFSVGI
jgi:hypothetical protein